MALLTPQELSKLWKKYDSSHQKLLAAADKAVVEWKYANEIMTAFIPYGEQLFNGFRGWGNWLPTRRHWLTGKLTPDCCAHGYDAEGRVRVIRRQGSTTKVFVYQGQTIDVLELGDNLLVTRDVMKAGRTQVEYTASRKPHQCSYEVFKYDQQKRCVGSIVRGWYFKNPKEKWVPSLPTTYTYEADDQGLVRAFRDMGPALGGKELVFVRPEAPPVRTRPKPQRRPLVVYVQTIKKSKEGPRPQILANVRALEQGIDPDWPMDTVVLTHPDYVDAITQETGLTRKGTVFAGAASFPASGTVAQLKQAKAKWILIDGSEDDALEHFQQALAERFSMIFHAGSPAQVETLCRGLTRIDPKALAIAWTARAKSRPDAVQKKAAEIREVLRSHQLDDCRLIVSANVAPEKIGDYLDCPDVDGVLSETGNEADVLARWRAVAQYFRT